MSIDVLRTDRLVIALVIALLHAVLLVLLGNVWTAPQPLPRQSLQLAWIAQAEPQRERALKTQPSVDFQSVVPRLPAPQLALSEEISDRSTVMPTATNSFAPQAVTASELAPIVISEVEYIRAPQPEYPVISRRLRERGTVWLRVLVNELGQAARIDVANSSGHERLDHAAREAVSRAAFKPYVENGVARAVLVLVPVEFAVRKSRAP